MTGSAHIREGSACRREEYLAARQEALLALGRDAVRDDPDVAVRRMTEGVARVLGVERVGVWRHTPDRRAIRCVDLYETTPDRHSAGAELPTNAYPAYFRELEACEVIAADDATADPRTREFAAGYLTTLGIGAMLDVPLHPFGRLEGVLCCEHVGPARAWTADEQVFAVAAGNLVSLAQERWDRERAERVLALQTAVLEAVATGAPLGDVLTRLAVGVEKVAPGLVCSVLLLDGDRLRDGAGPSLPAAYRAAIDGAAVGPAAGSCGAAAFRGEPVVVTDIETDPLWADYRHLALPSGLRACWSTPVFGRDGRVLATFALYHGTPRGPRPEEEALVGTATHLVAVAVERRRAEEALRASEERARAILAALPDLVFVLSADGTHLDCHAPRPAALYARPDEFIGKRLRDVLPADAAGRYEEAIGRVLATRAPQGFGYELDFPGAGRRAFEARMVPKGDGVLAIVRDVTEQRRLEEQFRQAQKMEAVGRLAGGIAHDFNNLLTVINGFADLLYDQLPPDAPTREPVEHIRKAGARAGELTHQLLAYGRKQILRPQPLNLGALVTNLGAMLRRLIRAPVELVIDPAPVRVAADPGLLEQALMNLVVNAGHAMPRGGTLTIATRAVTLGPGTAHDGADVRPGRYAELRVTDTGCGMPPEVLAHLFEPFFTTKGVGEGTGLGLATVYGIVRQSGGHVAVETAVGAGTTFRVYLPAAVPGPGPPAERARPAPPA
ncbi:GAF domain-containing protein, partial [bacterium]|nr:GAF domain-containing protein [bacterium]